MTASSGSHEIAPSHIPTYASFHWTTYVDVPQNVPEHGTNVSHSTTVVRAPFLHYGGGAYAGAADEADDSDGDVTEDGDTSDDSDPDGADAVPDEAGGVTAPEGSVVGDAIGDSVSEPDSEVSMPSTAPTLPWNAWDEPEWEPAIE